MEVLLTIKQLKFVKVYGYVIEKMNHFSRTRVGCSLFLYSNSSTILYEINFFILFLSRAVFVRFSLGGQSFDWRLATIAGMEVARLVPWNSLLN